MKYTTIESQGQKWLRPINVPYPNEDDQEEEGIFQLADAVLYKQMTADLLYIGSKPAGTTLDESEVREVRQHRHVFDPERAFFTLNKNTLWLWEHRDAHSDIEFRTAYTDAEPSETDESIDRKKAESLMPLVKVAADESRRAQYWETRAKAAESALIALYPGNPTKALELMKAWEEITKQEPK